MVPPTYSVVFDGQSGTPDFSTTTDIISGNTISLPSDPTRSNYTFGGWFTEIDGGGTEFTASTPVVANITVYAKWTAIVAICEVSGDVTDPDCWSVANNGGRAWGPTGYTTGLTELTSAVDNGPANTVTLAALGSNYQAATYCDTLDEGGHQDWYLPAKSQLIAGLNAYKDNYNSDPSWGGFAGEWVIYWSSTESSGSNNNAWYAYYGSNQVTSGATNKDWTGHYDHCLR